MAFYWIKTNQIIKRIFSNQIWDIPNPEQKIYLTFDDGPTPEITEWVLSVLKKHQVKATFFCLGNNIQKSPEIFQKIIAKGHAIGNHTFNHLQGWKTASEDYLENIKQCEQEIALQVAHMEKSKFHYHTEPTEEQSQQAASDRPLKLFRPPYGKITPKQTSRLQQLGYKIIMWDVLSADFDTTITKEQCFLNVIKNVKSGSIIVFHDSQKAFKNLEYALPRILVYLKEKGFSFETL